MNDYENEFVKELKNNNLWSKMMAIYPMVGGTATSNKFNLKINPKYRRIDKIKELWCDIL